MPTTRDPHTKLALSSRNAYLTSDELKVAPILYEALSSTKTLYSSSSTDVAVTGEDLISTATKQIMDQQANLTSAGSAVELKLDYVEVFDKTTFEAVRGPIEKGRELVIAGAVWVGKTRLIDNLLLGWDVN